MGNSDTLHLEALRVVLIHNFYQEPGGEDEVFRAEAELLRSYGHHVTTYSATNDDIREMSPGRVAASLLWNTAAHRELQALFAAERPDVVHFHNTFPLISPAAYYAARKECVPVVQTLHNYRLLCPNGLFFREERVCEDCLGTRTLWPGVAHACYRANRRDSAACAAMVVSHRALGTWSRAVDKYIALSEFSRSKFVAAGFDPAQVAVKPNFLPVDPGPGRHDGRYALFVGRLSAEKGLRTLVSAWETLGDTIPLRVVGDGPLAGLAEQSPKNVQWLGRLPKDEVLSLMKGAQFLVLPSECYENFPVTLVEAFATGLPVLASSLGAVGELVQDELTGLHFRPGDPAHLAAAVRRAIHDPSALAAMGRRGRREYEEKFTAAENHRRLLGIYRSADRRTPVHG